MCLFDTRRGAQGGGKKDGDDMKQPATVKGIKLPSLGRKYAAAHAEKRPGVCCAIIIVQRMTAKQLKQGTFRMSEMQKEVRRAFKPDGKPDEDSGDESDEGGEGDGAEGGEGDGGGGVSKPRLHALPAGLPNDTQVYAATFVVGHSACLVSVAETSRGSPSAASSIIGTVGDARHRNRASMTSKQLFEKLQPEYELHGGEWKKRQVCVQF